MGMYQQLQALQSQVCKSSHRSRKVIRVLVSLSPIISQIHISRKCQFVSASPYMFKWVDKGRIEQMGRVCD